MWKKKSKGNAKLYIYNGNVIVVNFLGIRYKDKWFDTLENAKKYIEILPPILNE